MLLPVPEDAVKIRYSLFRPEALRRFLAYGRVEIDTNIVERAIGPKTKRRAKFS
jgi:transposase